MAFDISKEAVARRAAPQWLRYESPTASALFKVRPRNPEIVAELNARFALGSAGSRGGRNEDLTTQSQKWTAGYVLAHLADWDVEMDGQRAPITLQTVAALPSAMLDFIVGQSMSDDLQAFAVPAPPESEA
jgi:hypothetical protein